MDSLFLEVRLMEKPIERVTLRIDATTINPTQVTDAI